MLGAKLSGCDGAGGRAGMPRDCSACRCSCDTEVKRRQDETPPEARQRRPQGSGRSGLSGVQVRPALPPQPERGGADGAGSATHESLHAGGA